MALEQVNVEYFFRLFYDLFYGTHATALSYASFQSMLAYVWLWIVGIGYALSIIGLLVIVYSTVRLYEIRKREAEYYSTLIPSAETTGGANLRWEHIEKLAGGTSPSEWKEAIIEADIMLDDVLAQQGYVGEGVGEKLKTADKLNFSTLQEAWEAHKVRNQIAHEGSSFVISDSLAHRTIAHYKAVCNEFKAI